MSGEPVVFAGSQVPGGSFCVESRLRVVTRNSPLFLTMRLFWLTKNSSFSFAELCCRRSARLGAGAERALDAPNEARVHAKELVAGVGAVDVLGLGVEAVDFAARAFKLRPPCRFGSAFARWRWRLDHDRGPTS